MKFILVILASVAAHRLHKADLPHNAEFDKYDPVSRYVNDDDLVQIRRGDLPHDL